MINMTTKADLLPLIEIALWMSSTITIAKLFRSNKSIVQLIVSSCIVAMFIAFLPLILKLHSNVSTQLILKMLIMGLIMTFVIISIAYLHAKAFQNNFILVYYAYVSIVMPMLLRKQLDILPVSSKWNYQTTIFVYSPMLILMLPFVKAYNMLKDTSSMHTEDEKFTYAKMESVRDAEGYSYSPLM